MPRLWILVLMWPFKRKNPWYGDRPECGHDWREHLSENDEPSLCSECLYEIEHEFPEALSGACTREAPERKPLLEP